MRLALRGSQGSVTAEFAAAIPAVVLVLAACLGSIQVAGQQLRLQDAAADAARIVARGEPGSAAGHVGRLVPGASLTVGERGQLVCVTASAGAAASGPLAALVLTASSCALGGGR